LERFRFADEANVVAQANDTEFGLAAYFYAKDVSRVRRVTEALEYGWSGSTPADLHGRSAVRRRQPVRAADAGLVRLRGSTDAIIHLTAIAGRPRDQPAI
jgi:Aldehyde dehydrogenase family